MKAEEKGIPANIDDLQSKAEQVIAGYQESLGGLPRDEVLQLMNGLLSRVTELEDQNQEIHHQLESKKSPNNRTAGSLQVEDGTFRSVVQTASDAIITSNEKGNIIFWNKAAAAIFGFTQDEIAGKPISTIMPKKFRTDHLKGLERVVSTGKPHILGKTVVMVGQKKSGDEFPIELTLSSWDSGEQIFFTSIIRDITDRTQIEEELRSLARFPSENRNPVMRISHDGVVLYANKASHALLTYWDCQVGQPLPKPWRQRLTKVMVSKESHTQYVNCDERVYSLDIISVLNAGYITIYGKDETERRQAEVLLEEQNQFITSVFNAIRDPLYVINVSDYTVQMSNPAANLDNVPAPVTCYSINHRQNKPCAQLGNHCPLEDVKITKRPAVAEHIHYDREGNQSFVELHAHPIFNRQGEITQVIEYSFDITDRKKMELAVKESEAKWRSLTQYSPDRIVMLDTNLNIQYLNASAGVSTDELIGVPLWKLADEERQLEVKEIHERVLETGKPDRYETIYYDPDGGMINFESHVVPFKVDDQLEGLVVSARDVTERKRIEVVLSERTHALGERVKELNCLYQISAFIEEPDKTLADILKRTIELIPSSWQYPGVTGARIILGEQEYRTTNYDEHSLWIMSADIMVHGQTEGNLEVCYLERRTRSGESPFSKERRTNSSEGPFLAEERSLLNAIVGRLGKIVERIRAEEALQKAHIELEYRVEERTAELNNANKALEIENAERIRAYQAEYKARQTAEILQNASLALSKNLDLKTVIELFLDYAHQLVPYKLARVFLIEDESYLSIRAERGPDKFQTNTAIQIDPSDDPIIDKLLNQQKSILVPDTESGSGLLHPNLNLNSAHSWMGIPLLAENKVIGISIFEDSKSKAFSEEHVQLLEVLVGLVTVNIQNSWLFEQVRNGRERLQSLSQRLVEVQESERRYISRELHDEASQTLTSLKVGLRLIERDAHDSEMVIAGVAELKTIADGVIENLHRLAMDLRPVSLDHLGLVAALSQYVEEISNRHKLALEFETIGLDDRLASETETAIYRIVQEALSNVILHAQATRAAVVLEKRGREVIVIVEDNGIGFDPRAAARSGRLGLIGIKERVDMLGGSMTIESQPEVGTTLYLEVPYDR